MKRVRSVFFWLHLTAGSLGAVVILVMSFTGTVLALKPQIQNWVDRDVRVVTPPATPRLAASALLSAVKTARPEASVQSVAFDRDPGVAATVNLGRDGNVFVNPYDGAILGSPSAGTVQFFQTMTSWHRYMGASGESRAAGRAATGASNLAFLFLSLSGLYLWWPSALTTRHLRPIIWFKKSGTSRARDFNWHNSIGFWCLIPIVIMTMSGVVMSYQWGNNVVYRLTGSPIPTRGGEGARGPGAPGAGQPTIIPEALDQIVARAEQQMPTWSQLSFRLPNRDGGPVAFTLTDGAHWNPMARNQLTLDGRTADVVQWQPYVDQNLGQRARGWMRFGHTGELGGLPGQIVAGLGCLGGMFLVYTGLALACRRLLNWSVWASFGLKRRGTDAVAHS
ncbi:MAG: PepSY-associated TM helix domain-containing protein [Vicinamibacterales bacterium]